MKKIYVSPRTEAYVVNCDAIIATSISVAGGPGTGADITGTNYSEYSQDGREDNAISNIWDSEW